MPDILSLISSAERLDFSRNFSVFRPNYLGDRLFPDQKTENLMAEYLRLANGAAIPVMATVHAFDTEAEIGSRPAFDKVTIEKLLIKRKINETERMRLMLEHGTNSNDAIVRYVFDDMRLMADAVKARTEAAKMEVLSSGKMQIKENNLDFEVDYGVPSENAAYTIDLSPDADIVGQVQEIVDDAANKGYIITEAVTSNKIMRKLAANKGIQTLVYGSLGQGTFVSNEKVQEIFSNLFGISTISRYDATYKYERANGTQHVKRFYPEDKITFLGVPQGNVSVSLGIGLWGVTPEEEAYGPFTEKSMEQFITITQWATPDPVAVWTKASGVFIPVLPDPGALFIATEATSGTLGSLTVTSTAGSATGDTSVTVSPAKASGNVYKYKVADSATSVTYGQNVQTWTAWDGSADITAATGKVITIVEADSSYKAVKAGSATVTAKA